jgi:plastocyanin
MPSRRFRSIAVAAAGMAILGAGCSGNAAAGSAPVATEQVDLPASYRFEPAVIQVHAGATVIWTNHDHFTHSVQVEGGEVHVMKPEESASLTFDAPGEHPYLCTFHSQNMKGKVIVEPR